MSEQKEQLACKQCNAKIKSLTGGMLGGHLYCAYTCDKCGYRQHYKVIDGKRIEIDASEIHSCKKEN